MNKFKTSFWPAYLDLLQQVLCVFIVLFIGALAMVNEKQQDPTVKRDAEYVIVISWDPNINCDVDLHVKNSLGQWVYYNYREDGLMHLERDDLGWANDTIVLEDGSILTVNKNEETWVLRGIVPADYIANLHLYSCRDEDVKSKVGEIVNPIAVKMELIKLNPKYTSIVVKTVYLDKVFKEFPGIGFTVNKSGNIVNITDNPNYIINIQNGNVPR